MNLNNENELRRKHTLGLAREVLWNWVKYVEGSRKDHPEIGVSRGYADWYRGWTRVQL